MRPLTMAFAIAAWALVSPALRSTSAHASSCVAATGPFATSLKTGNACPNSPIHMCTHGRLSGEIEADYDFIFENVTPDSVDPSRTNYTGQSVITFANDARIFSHDTGFVLSQPNGPSQFETTVEITGGSGQGTSASGRILAQGQIDSTGMGVGSYTASICVEHPPPGCSGN